MEMFIDLIAFLPHAGSNGSKMNLNLCIISVTLWFLPGLRAEKLNLDALNNYSEFLNFGDKKLHKIGENRLENAIFKSKLDVLGEVFKKHVDFFKVTDKLDIVFLVDASSSVGDGNFKSELKFIKKLLSDITVDYNHTRVAVVTFSSPTNTIKNIDDISDPSKEYNKCLLLNDQLMKIEYKGGETYTIGAFAKAKEIFDHSLRNDSKKVIFLVTDGYSNGENPVPLSNELKRSQITIFTIGIRNGNYKELYDLSSTPGQFYSYLLDSFEEFESLARRALHVDLSGGDYLPLGVSTPCDKLCEAGNCCDKDALCACGTTTGHYSCTCKPGFYGSGLRNDCLPCTPGTYSDGPNLCLPCPDVHHTTILPAQGIDRCICKKGFQSDGTGGCQSKDQFPKKSSKYGYIVKKKECSNVLNSACGLRCEVGYTLVGSSIRLCQENATWTGSDPTCEVKTCNRLPTPKYGSVKCEQIDLDVVYDSAEKNLPVDTVCNFQCENGTVLIGSTQRTCLPIAQWDGLRAICKQIKCNKLPEVRYARIEPSSCTAGKQEFGKTCKIICNDGFKAAGSTVKTCGNHGLWGRKQEENTVCTDSTPPDLECPQNISASAVPGTNYGQVSWTEPNITDNSGLEVSTWLKPAIVNVTEYKFSIGLTPVTYFAQDPFHNAIKCKFFVEILDQEPPVIEECINPAPFLVSPHAQENISWDEPNIFDNSQNVSITKSHEFGRFPIGTTLVTYTAKDPSGNLNICNLNITVEESECPEFTSPSHGRSECADQSESRQCVITCEEGYAIPLQSSEATSLENSSRFECNHAEALWHNTEGLLYPECSVTVVGDQTQEGDVQVSLDGDGCNNTDQIGEIQNSIKSMISNNICTGLCEIDLKSECEVEKSEEESNKLLSRRRRRDSAGKKSQSLQGVPHKNSRARQRKRNRLNVKFQVRGRYLNESKGPDLRLETHNSSVKLKNAKFVCPEGFIPRKNRCVQCPRGTFHNATSNICQSCDFGSYTDRLGTTSCLQCPPNHSTRKIHSKNASECRKMCPPGTHARKKRVKTSKQQNPPTVERATLSPHCKSCPVGTYQPEYGKIKCLACPVGFTTAKAQSVNSTECIPTSKGICALTPDVCNHGKCVVVNEYEFSCECLPGFVGNCSEGFSGQFCEIVAEKEAVCDLKCQNGGTCLDVGENELLCLCSSGFSGTLCETRKNYCQDVICENNSTCIEHEDSFRCICAKGFLGRRCNILPCDYKPCKENSLCTNLELENATKSDFRCTCLEGYSGPNCQKIDYCTASKCENGGKCISKETSFMCSCSKLYEGDFCQFKRETNYMLNFSRYDTNDFIRLRGFEMNLTEITACLWIQTLDNFNYGTLLSYATRYTDNAFTLTDYTGIVFYVNKQYVVTDVLLNDGHWHHICVSWRSSGGTYQMYLDGELAKNGSDLAAYSEIGAHGYLIIGQEQDALGGRFSQSESFVGNMAYVDLWSRVLTLQEINEHRDDCSDSILGDLYAWPEMQQHTNGNIQRLSSTFCQRCEDPKPLYNGFIDMMDNRAFYSCYRGFELSSKHFSKGRRCTKTSKWEGFYEPFCKRITCGYPGTVKNGYSIGNQYFYSDKISYKCFDGFSMIGGSTIVCKEDGKWFPAKPKCVGVQCTLPKVPNGKIEIISEAAEESLGVNRVDSDTQIRVKCFSNSTLKGENPVATCLEDGTWDNPNISCKFTASPQLNCPLHLIPVAPENGYLDENSLNAMKNGTADFVEYKCRSGYSPVGVNISTCIVDGYWTEPNITCQAITCPSPPLFLNMVLKSKEPHMLTYQCQEGYKLVGNAVIQCTTLGKWSRLQGKCTRLSCGKPAISAGAKVTGNSYLYGDSLTITCPNGKSFKITCEKSGSWSENSGNNC
ncbi:hypothetical protein HUJ05_000441 [Dendroctonus ponderosae]|nr:hypothetical protein HUJ05_000441 [Dendroctonus ponderosae]